MFQKRPLVQGPVITTAAWFIIAGCTVAFLMFFRTFLQPFVVALILWFVIGEFRFLLTKIKIKGKGLSKGILTVISALVIFYLFYVSIDIIIVNIQKLTRNIGEYSNNLVMMLEGMEKTLGIENLGESVEGRESQIISAMTSIAGGLASFVGRFFLVILYVIFLLLEEFGLSKKLNFVVSKRSSNVSESMKRIMSLFRAYMSIKMFSSFMTGFLSYFVLLFLGIDVPALWAFIIFLLNFIPSVGSIIATAFPVIFSAVQYGDLSKSLYVLVGVLSIQVLIGNVVEPRLLGNRLNLSPIVILLGLTFWGYVWGVVGMLLSVPIMAMMMIIFSQFDNTRNIAIFFSHDGNLGEMMVDAKGLDKT
jgi:AI-2 transport protein TqsA